MESLYPVEINKKREKGREKVDVSHRNTKKERALTEGFSP